MLDRLAGCNRQAAVRITFPDSSYTDTKGDHESLRKSRLSADLSTKTRTAVHMHAYYLNPISMYFQIGECRRCLPLVQCMVPAKVGEFLEVVECDVMSRGDL